MQHQNTKHPQDTFYKPSKHLFNFYQTPRRLFLTPCMHIASIFQKNFRHLSNNSKLHAPFKFVQDTSPSQLTPRHPKTISKLSEQVRHNLQTSSKQPTNTFNTIFGQSASSCPYKWLFLSVRLSACL